MTCINCRRQFCSSICSALEHVGLHHSGNGGCFNVSGSGGICAGAAGDGGRHAHPLKLVASTTSVDAQASEGAVRFIGDLRSSKRGQAFDFAGRLALFEAFGGPLRLDTLRPLPPSNDEGERERNGADLPHVRAGWRRRYGPRRPGA